MYEYEIQICKLHTSCSAYRCTDQSRTAGNIAVNHLTHLSIIFQNGYTDRCFYICVNTCCPSYLMRAILTWGEVTSHCVVFFLVTGDVGDSPMAIYVPIIGGLSPVQLPVSKWDGLLSCSGVI